ncbi:hypothetical protein JHK84_047760 [Glycine max]|nr:hypothetical protein JHK84_047760 [Glycine max]
MMIYGCTIIPWRVILNSLGLHARSFGKSVATVVSKCGTLRELSGFYGQCDHTMNMHVELLAILNGMHHAWNNRFRHIIIEIYFLVVIHLIEQQSASFHMFATMVASIMSLLTLQ